MFSEHAIVHVKDQITCSICAHKTATSRFYSLSRYVMAVALKQMGRILKHE